MLQEVTTITNELVEGCWTLRSPISIRTGPFSGIHCRRVYTVKAWPEDLCAVITIFSRQMIARLACKRVWYEDVYICHRILEQSWRWSLLGGLVSYLPNRYLISSMMIWLEELGEQREQVEFQRGNQYLGVMNQIDVKGRASRRKQLSKRRERWSEDTPRHKRVMAPWNFENSLGKFLVFVCRRRQITMRPCKGCYLTLRRV